MGMQIEGHPLPPEPDEAYPYSGRVARQAAPVPGKRAFSTGGHPTGPVVRIRRRLFRKTGGKELMNEVIEMNILIAYQGLALPDVTSGGLPQPHDGGFCSMIDRQERNGYHPDRRMTKE
jgi:hypothetical protein